MRRPDRGRRRRAGRLSRCTPASHAPTKQRTSSGIRSLLPTNRNCSSELPLSSAAYIDLVGARTPSYRYWFERLARLPVEAHLASEFHYREAPLRPGDAAAFVSQSGEAADPLASLHYAREQGQHILSIVNAASTIARASGVVMPTLAGPEIGVASTKA